jgi:ABC-2 type transport system ATP-binding protein
MLRVTSGRLKSKEIQVRSNETGGDVTDPLVVEELMKTYPGPVEAVRGVSFRAASGEIFGLLGPNGAGKTTTIEILTTLVEATSGWASVAGHDVRSAALAVRRSIGVVFQDSVLDNDFSGRENLLLHARLWRVADAHERIEPLLAAVGLADRGGDPVRIYSGGMRRRLEIARALLARPKVMFLDEPTLGLDPLARRDLWQVVRILRERFGVTIVLSTHYLEEAQEVCDRVAIMDRGRIVAEGEPTRLISELGDEIVDLRVDGDGASVRDSLAALESLGKVLEAGSTLSVASHHTREALVQRVNALPLSALGVTSMTVRPATLNDVFLFLTSSDSERALATIAGGGGV